MKAIVFLIIVFSPKLILCQEIGKIDSDKLKKGIYKSLEELKCNNPSLSLDYHVVKISHMFGMLINDEEHDTYQLSLSEVEFSNLGWYFGFCDGHDIYINPDPLNLKRKTEFEKLQIIKPLSYFERLMINYDIVESGKGLYSKRKAQLVSYVLDIPSGNISELTPDLVNEMLWNDSASMPKIHLREKSLNFQANNKYRNRTSNKNYLLSFYTKSNNCKTSLRNHLGIIGLVDFVKEQSTDTSYMVYYSRVMNELKDNPYFSKVKLSRKDYSNGNCKRIGIVAYQGEVPYYIGIWSSFDKKGKRSKVEEYNLNAKKIRVERY